MLLPSIRDGYRLLHQGHYQQAGRLAERLVATNNQNPHVLAFAAEACMACGDARKSLRLIDQAAATTAGSKRSKTCWTRAARRIP